MRNVGEELLLLGKLILSWLLVCESADLMLLLLFEGEVGELWAERYRLPLEGRERIEGSDKLAIALDVLSRANAANVKNPPRLCFDELVDSVD